MTLNAIDIPACGLYRTTLPLPGQEEAIPAGRLVYFHNHSDQNKPIVLLPKSNTHNRWTFHERGNLVEDADFILGLEPLKVEGYYRLREHFHPNQEEIVADDQIVQLGYTPDAEALIFFPKISSELNALIFPERGMKIPAQIYDLLEPLVTTGPFVPKQRHVH